MFLWYVINTYSGHENKVKANLEHRIVSMNQSPRFRRVVVPTEQVIETKDGQKVQIEKRVLPGYVLVNMDLNDEAWTVVKGTPGVTAFVGAGAKPSPLSQPEVDRILHAGGAAGAPAARAQVEFTLGESVKVTSGPLSDFDGEIVDVNADAQKLKVLVDIFERQVPVELAFDQVKKIDWIRCVNPLRPTTEKEEGPRPARTHDGKESTHTHQVSDPRWAGEPCAAGRACARPARRQHRRVHEGVQRADRAGERPDHPGRDHGLRGSLVHVHHEDAARGGADQGGAQPPVGLRRAEPDKVGKLTEAQLRSIAEAKMPDLNANDVEAAMLVIAGTARSMGVEVEK